MREIWQKTRQLDDVYDRDTPGGSSVSPALLENCARLKLRLGELEACVQRIGAMPSIPPRARGRVGALAVQLVRRALFWLIPPLCQAHEKTLEVLREQALLMEALVKAVQQAEREVQLLLRLTGTSRLD